jgi:hypothetical protein
MSIPIQVSTEMIHGSALARAGISIVTVGEGHRHLLLDFRTLLWFAILDLKAAITLTHDVEILGRSCFSHYVLMSVDFESRSNLRRI